MTFSTQVWGLLVHNQRLADRLNGKPVREGDYQVITDATEAFPILEGAAELVPLDLGKMPRHSRAWAPKWIQDIFDSRAQSTLFQKGADANGPDALALDAGRRNATLTGIGQSETGEEVTPGKNGATVETCERIILERIYRAFSFGCSAQSALQATKTWLSDATLAAVDVASLVSKVYEKGSPRGAWGEFSGEPDAAFYRARQESEAEKERVRREEAHANGLASVAELRKALPADGYILNEMTGVVDTAFTYGGISPDFDRCLEQRREGNRWFVRPNSPMLECMKMTRRDLGTKITRTNALTFRGDIFNPAFHLGREIESCRNVEKRALPDSETTDLKDPRTWFWLEQVEAANACLWPQIYGGFEEDANVARELAAARYAAFGIDREVAKDHLKKNADAKFQEMLTNGAPTPPARSKPNGASSSDIKFVEDQQAIRHQKQQQYFREQADKLVWRDRTIETMIDWAYDARTCWFTPCSLRTAPSQDWLNRFHAEEPSMDPLAPTIIAMLDGPEYVTGTDFEESLAAKGETITPSWRSRVAQLMSHLGFGKKQIKIGGHGKRVWAKRTEAEARPDDGEDSEVSA